MNSKNHYDVEARTSSSPVEYGEKPSYYNEPIEGVHGESFEIGNTTYAKIQRAAGKLFIEQRGIERVPEDERTDKTLSKAGTMVRRARRQDVETRC